MKLTNHLRRTLQVPMASCSDCDLYTPVDSLIPKADNRRICPDCQGKSLARAQERRQLEMFCAQTSLFDPIG